MSHALRLIILIAFVTAATVAISAVSVRAQDSAEPAPAGKAEFLHLTFL